MQHYDPASDTWRPLGRCWIDEPAAWTGRLILSTYAAYEPATETCLRLPAAPARSAQFTSSGREFHSGAWTGDEWILFSGGTASDYPYRPNDGVAFRPGQP